MVDNLMSMLQQRGIETDLYARYNSDISGGLRAKVGAFFLGNLLSARAAADGASIWHSTVPTWCTPTTLSLAVAVGSGGLPPGRRTRRVDAPRLQSRLPKPLPPARGTGVRALLRRPGVLVHPQELPDDIFHSVACATRMAAARKFRMFHKNVTLFMALTAFAKGRLVAADIDPRASKCFPIP